MLDPRRRRGAHFQIYLIHASFARPSWQPIFLPLPILHCLRKLRQHHLLLRDLLRNKIPLPKPVSAHRILELPNHIIGTTRRLRPRKRIHLIAFLELNRPEVRLSIALPKPQPLAPTLPRHLHSMPAILNQIQPQILVHQIVVVDSLEVFAYLFVHLREVER